MFAEGPPVLVGAHDRGAQRADPCRPSQPRSLGGHRRILARGNPPSSLDGTPAPTPATALHDTEGRKPRLVCCHTVGGRYKK